MFTNIFELEDYLVPIYQVNGKFLCNGMIISTIRRISLTYKGKKRYCFNFIPSNFIKLLKRHNITSLNDAIPFSYCANESRRIKGKFFTYTSLWSPPNKNSRYIALSRLLKRRTCYE